MLRITKSLINHQSFIYTHLNDEAVLTIQFSISHLLAYSSNVKQFYLNTQIGPYQVLPLLVRVNLEAMAFPKARALLKPHHQIVSCHIQGTHWGSFTPLLRCSLCILYAPASQLGHFNLWRLSISQKRLNSLLCDCSLLCPQQ